MIKIIKENTTAEITIKKSRFIANVFKVDNEKEAKDIIKKIDKKYHDAKHNCYAFKIQEINLNNNSSQIIERFNDDGEPSGTAGSPILDVIKKRKLNNIIVIVTRYFGGILLGTGGLIRAYSDVTIQAIEKVEEINMEYGIQYKIEIPYNELKNVMYECNKLKAKVMKCEYSENIKLTIESNHESKERIIREINNLISTKIVKENILIEI